MNMVCLNSWEASSFLFFDLPFMWLLKLEEEGIILT